MIFKKKRKNFMEFKNLMNVFKYIEKLRRTRKREKIFWIFCIPFYFQINKFSFQLAIFS